MVVLPGPGPPGRAAGADYISRRSPLKDRPSEAIDLGCKIVSTDGCRVLESAEKL